MQNLIPFRYKLGKLAPKPHPWTLKLEDFLTPDAKAGFLPDIPARVFREYKVPENSWGMYGNDSIRDCTCAAKAHTIILQTGHTGKIFIPDVQPVIEMYSAISGYDPATGANDNGCAMTDVLQYMVTTGLQGHKYLGWAAIDPKNALRIKQGIYIFGVVDTGFQVPQSAMDQFQAGQDWDVVPNSPIEGGHDVPYYGDGSRGYSCLTWAKNQKLTLAFESAYTDETYALISQDWLSNADGLAPNMLNLDSLQAALKAIAA